MVAKDHRVLVQPTLHGREKNLYPGSNMGKSCSPRQTQVKEQTAKDAI